MTANPPDIYSVDDLAALLRMTPRSVRWHIAKGHISGAFKIGRRVFVNREAFERGMVSDA